MNVSFFHFIFFTYPNKILAAEKIMNLVCLRPVFSVNVLTPCHLSKLGIFPCHFSPLEFQCHQITNHILFNFVPVQEADT
jgi:hypothetical protein